MTARGAAAYLFIFLSVLMANVVAPDNLGDVKIFDEVIASHICWIVHGKNVPVINWTDPRILSIEIIET
jgi:hypothetical protein